MKTQLCYLKQLILLGLVLLSLGTSAQEIGGTFDARLEEKMGKTHLNPNHWMVTRSKQWTPLSAAYSGAYRGPKANFLAEENGTQVAFYFTAETKGHDMELRALVDGVMIDPGAISFSSGLVPETRSFIFTGTFDEGIHTIQLEWRGLQDNKTVFIRDVSLLIRKDDSKNVGQMAMKSLMLNSNVVNNNWVDVPNSLLHIDIKPGDVLIASVALETIVAPGASLHLRALVNGIPMLPSNVLFAKGNTFQAKTMTFGFNGLYRGKKSVKFQWKVSGNGIAGVQGRTFVASAMPKDATNCDPHMKFKAAPSGPTISTSSSIMKPIPDMEMEVSIPENGEMAIIFSAESYGSSGSEAMVSLEIDHKFYSTNMVTLAKGDQYLGVHSFVFVVKHLNAKSNASLKNVKLHWSAGSGGTAYMGDRSMAVLVEKGGVPDLAEPPAIGGVQNPVLGVPGGIEPMTGTVPLLTVIIDPNRQNVPKPSWSDVNDLLFGTYSTRDYYNKISGGRFNLTNAGVFNVIPNNLPDPDIYWEQHSCDCKKDENCDEEEDYLEIGYTGGHQRKWADAMDGIDGAFNFAAYDKNKDGILDPRELAILVITPQADEAGTVREFRPYCEGHPNVPNTLGGYYYADGVKFVAIAEWYTAADDSMDFITPTHELGHLLLNLGDLYIDDFEVYTEAGQYDLMGDANGASPHLQGRTKLALGWATPTFIRKTTLDVKVSDVRNSEHVIILPRTNGVDGQEFFLLENRGHKDVDANYDENIWGAGIAIWHIVESSGDYNFAPLTDACENLWIHTDDGKARRSSRLIRLKKGKGNENGGGGGGSGNGTLNNNTGPNRELWKKVPAIEQFSAYDLTSFGFVCPDVWNKNFGNMALVWADYSPSGYSIINWPTYGPNMYLDILAPQMGFGTGGYPCPDDSDPIGGVVGGKRRESLVANEIVSVCDVYPNPFREYANFRFSLKQNAQAKLEIFNLRGQRVAIPFEGRVEAGVDQKGKWHAGDLATGLYIYRLTSDAGDVHQGKINLIK